MMTSSSGVPARALFCVAVLAAGSADATISRRATLRFQNPGGAWSAPYTQVVTFGTGSEVSQTIGSFGYDLQVIHALVRTKTTTVVLRAVGSPAKATLTVNASNLERLFSGGSARFTEPGSRRVWSLTLGPR